MRFKALNKFKKNYANYIQHLSYFNQIPTNFQLFAKEHPTIRTTVNETLRKSAQTFSSSLHPVSYKQSMYI